MQPQVPTGCQVVGASYLFRHSDIYANEYVLNTPIIFLPDKYTSLSFDYENVISPFLQKYGNFTSKSLFNASEALSFLTNWTSPYGNITAEMENVTPLGIADAVALGQLFALRYPALLNGTSGSGNITLWAASANRSETTANAFVSGLGMKMNTSVGFNIQVIQEEEDQGGNTLTPHESCET